MPTSSDGSSHMSSMRIECFCCSGYLVSTEHLHSHWLEVCTGIPRHSFCTMLAFRQTENGPKPMHLGPHGESELCVQRVDWTSNHYLCCSLRVSVRLGGCWFVARTTQCQTSLVDNVSVASTILGDASCCASCLKVPHIGGHFVCLACHESCSEGRLDEGYGRMAVISTVFCVSGDLVRVREDVQVSTRGMCQTSFCV